MSNYIPYEWYALLLMVLGNWQEVRRFEKVLKQAYHHSKTGEKMKTPIILWGPARSGKSTILNILELGFFTVNNINEMKNTIFVHDFDATRVPPFYANKMWNYMMAQPIVFAATNRIVSEELVPDREFIFGTTGQRFEKEVYEAILIVCNNHAEDIYKYYSEENS